MGRGETRGGGVTREEERSFVGWSVGEGAGDFAGPSLGFTLSSPAILSEWGESECVLEEGMDVGV